MNKVIFINRFFYPDHSATSQLLSDLAFWLASQNMEVCIIASRQIYDNPAAKLPAMETIQGVRVFRVWTSTFGRRILMGRALDYATFYIFAGLKLFFLLSRYDVVVAKTDPPLISVVAAIIVKIRGAILINWIQDMFPEVATALGLKGFDWFDAMLRTIRNFSFKGARINVVLGNLMAKKVASQGVTSDKIRVIHNWSDGKDIIPVPREQNELRREWGLSDKFVVGYSGNMGRAHEFETIIGAALLLKCEKEIIFLFIGNGARRKWIENEVNKLSLSNVVFKPYQTRETLAQSLCVPDVHIISLRAELEGLIVPSKFYGIAAAGRPMLYIGDLNGDIAQILNEEECGYTVKIGDVQHITEWLIIASMNKNMLVNMGNRARFAFENRFNKDIAFKAWAEVLNTSFPRKH